MKNPQNISKKRENIEKLDSFQLNYAPFYHFHPSILHVRRLPSEPHVCSFELQFKSMDICVYVRTLTSKSR